jgi:DNA-binding transcriptional MerR regulator
MERGLDIRDVAKLTGLSAHTLRHYERIGLLDAIDRAPGGQRRYAAADLDWIAFLTRLRATGMSIRQMQRFAELRRLGTASVAERRAMLEAHGVEVKQRLRDLELNLTAIDEKIEQYRAMEESRDQRD